MINVTLKLFGPLRDVMQRDELQLQVPPPYKGDTAFELLTLSNPLLLRWRPSVRLAVNMEYTSFDHVLKSGDEICFIPPVSGG